MLRTLLLALLIFAACLSAQPPVYVVLWFDTEDYIEPASDDAALRIANDLTALGVRATFKVVGEKARVLESRGRRDVIAALSRHAIGYHSNWHSVPPTPSEYLSRMGFLEGAAEFERREALRRRGRAARLRQAACLLRPARQFLGSAEQSRAAPHGHPGLPR